MTKTLSDKLLAETVYSLTSYAIRLTQDENDAKDLLQTTVLKALSNKPEHITTSLKSWVGVIMYNTFVNEIRRKKRHNVLHVCEQHVFDVIGPIHHPADQQMIVAEIYNAVQRLSLKYQGTIMLLIQGYSYKEIAEEAGAPIGTIKSRIYHARLQLINILNE